MTDQMFMVMADYGHGPEPDEGEVYSDLAFAWAQADEMQAEAGSDPVVYTVFALTAVERP